MLHDLRKIEVRKREVNLITQNLEKLMSSGNKQNGDRKILKIDKNRKRNRIPMPIRSTKADPNVYFKLFSKSINSLNAMFIFRTLKSLI